MAASLYCSNAKVRGDTAISMPEQSTNGLRRAPLRVTHRGMRGQGGMVLGWEKELGFWAGKGARVSRGDYWVIRTEDGTL